MKYLLFFPLALALALPSCGTKTGDPTPQTVISIQGTKPGDLVSAVISRNSFRMLTASSTTLEAFDRDGSKAGDITLTDARLSLSRIKIKLSDSDTTNDEVRFSGPFVVNLLTDAVTPSLPAITLSGGIYRQIELKLDKIEGGEDDGAGNELVPATDPLFENSIYLAGTYTGQSGGGPVSDVTFTMEFEFDEEFKLTPSSDSSEGFEIKTDENNNIIIAFRMARWFRFDNDETNENNVDFSDIQLESGEIHVHKDSPTTNKNIQVTVKENIKESADYGKDIDGDGKLDSSEDDDPDDEDQLDD